MNTSFSFSAALLEISLGLLNLVLGLPLLISGDLTNLFAPDRHASTSRIAAGVGAGFLRTGRVSLTWILASCTGMGYAWCCARAAGPGAAPSPGPGSSVGR
ncbi:MAG: hypothetical protein M3460_21745 [Actinomycetota bacterium]|nr:hypothetical protein [Actinomycetota bacterium]